MVWNYSGIWTFIYQWMEVYIMGTRICEYKIFWIPYKFCIWRYKIILHLSPKLCSLHMMMSEASNTVFWVSHSIHSDKSNHIIHNDNWSLEHCMHILKEYTLLWSLRSQTLEMWNLNSCTMVHMVLEVFIYFTFFTH